MEYQPKYIIVHHSAAANPLPQFEAIDRWHRDRGFTLSKLGFYVGYHRVIEADGTVRQAREDLERDCDAYGHNFDSLSVCMVGNFVAYFPTQAQKDALAALLSEWCNKYNLTHKDIFPHRHFGQTQCYGTKLGDDWAKNLYLEFEVERLKKELEALKLNPCPADSTSKN